MPQSSELIRKATDELIARTPKSRECAERAKKRVPLQVVGTVELPYTIYIESASGCRMTDVDGNEYIDVTMGFGPHILGHRPKVVLDAVKKQLDAGWHFGIPSPLQERLAKLVMEAASGNEAAIFCNSGTEATMYAVRAARAYTGKDKIAVFDGSYHGAHDYVLVQVDARSPRSEPTTRVRGDGVPKAVSELEMMLPYRDPAAFDLIKRHRDELAMVMIEPVQGSNPRLDSRSFIRTLAEVCKANGVLFGMDEVITGFRIAYGGCQEYYGVTPDLTAYGKILGGGMPIGAVAGRKELMSLFSTEQVMQMFAGRETRNAVFAGGTFCGNPLSMSAGIATLSYLGQHQQVYSYLQEQGDRLAKEVNDFCREREMPVQITNAASMFRIPFQKGPIDGARDYRGDYAEAEHAFYLHLLNNGVIVPGFHLGFLSEAHRPKDVDALIAAIKKSLEAVEPLFSTNSRDST